MVKPVKRLRKQETPYRQDASSVAAYRIEASTQTSRTPITSAMKNNTT